jgi:hypothetical protein
VGCNPNRRFLDGMSWPNVSAMASMKPYSLASVAVYQ